MSTHSPPITVPRGERKGDGRLGGVPRSRASLTIDGETVSFVIAAAGVSEFTLAIAGAKPATIATVEVRNRILVADLDGERVIAHTVRRGDQIDVSVNGDVVTVSLVGDAAAADPGEDDVADRIVAPLPGKVAAIAASTGDRVRKGSTLIVVEAMKMEHALAAPHNGTVDEVRCEVGQMVDEGAVLVTFSS